MLHENCTQSESSISFFKCIMFRTVEKSYLRENGNNGVVSIYCCLVTFLCALFVSCPGLKSWPYGAFSHTCQHERGASPGNEVGPAQMFQKGSVYIRKEFNSYRIGLVHHHGCGTPLWLPWGSSCENALLSFILIVSNPFVNFYFYIQTFQKCL